MFIFTTSHIYIRYDNHREQILRGSQTDYEDKSIDVYQYFTASCYRGFDDTQTGFYTIYRQIFEKIACEDIEFIECDDEFKSIPLFGKSTSDYDTIVGPFYAYWQSYCTKKSYSWLCPHNVTEIRDRRLLREIEKEMKKITQKARRERNDEIRALVAFVRKRDKRVVEHKKVLEERAEQNRVKQQEKRLEQLRKNQKDAAEMQKQQAKTFCTEGHEEKLRQMEDLYASTDDDDDGDDCSNDGSLSNYNIDNIVGDISNGAEQLDIEDVDADTATPPIAAAAATVDALSDLGYCIACDKSFKSKKSLQNHLSSKRHIENQRNHEMLMNPIDETNGDTESIDHQYNSSDDDLSEEEILIESKRKSGKNKSKKKTKAMTIKTIVADDDDDDGDCEKEENDIIDLLEKNLVEEKNDWSDDGKKSKKSKKSTKTESKSKLPTKSQEKQQTDSNADASSLLSSKSKNILFDQLSSASSEKQIDLNLTCVKCKSIFGSKNKLFNHLKATGHGVYIDKNHLNADTPINNGQSQKRIKKKQFYSKVTL